MCSAWFRNRRNYILAWYRQAWCKIKYAVLFFYSVTLNNSQIFPLRMETTLNKGNARFIICLGVEILCSPLFFAFWFLMMKTYELNGLNVLMVLFVVESALGCFVFKLFVEPFNGNFAFFIARAFCNFYEFPLRVEFESFSQA